MTLPKTLDLPSLNTVRDEIDNFLEKHYEARTAHAERLSPEYARLWRAILELHQAGGKRIRPYMMLLAYQSFGGKALDSVLPVAAATEMLHESLLIHDDIVDRDYVRHGEPNIAGKYLRHYHLADVDQETQTHLANSAALLAGDLLLSGTHRLVLESTLSLEQKSKVIDLFGNTMFTVAGGQLLDTESVLLPFEAADPLTVAHLKTADYSFVSPLVLGATLADASESDIEKLRIFGNALGVAFQLKDDLLGIFGKAQELGKSVITDLEERKRTYLMREAYTLADDTQRAQLDALFAAEKPTQKDLKKLRELLEKCGAKKATEKVIEEYGNRARTALAEFGFGPEIHLAFENLISMTVDRNA